MFYILDLNTNTKVPNLVFDTYEEALNWLENYGNIIDYTIVE